MFGIELEQHQKTTLLYSVFITICLALSNGSIMQSILIGTIMILLKIAFFDMGLSLGNYALLTYSGLLFIPLGILIFSGILMVAFYKLLVSLLQTFFELIFLLFGYFIIVVKFAILFFVGGRKND